MIETFAGAGVAAPPDDDAAGAPGVAVPPQAEMMSIAMIARAEIRSRMSFSFSCALNGHFGDRVGTPGDEEVLEPRHEPLRDDRDDGEDEHRREDPVRVEGALGRGGHQPDALPRAEVLADDRADQGEAEARVEAREDPRERGRQDDVALELALAGPEDARVGEQVAVDLSH